MIAPEQGNNWCEIFARQQSYLRGEGVRWAIGGSAAERKAGERILASLKEAGLMLLPRRRGQHRNVGLTVRGDDIARLLIGHPTAADGWPLLRAIVEAVGSLRGVGPKGPGVWLLEKQLIAADEWDVAAVHETTLPLAVHGLIGVGIDTDGELYYTATAAGKEAAVGPPPWPEDDIEPMPEAVEVYEDAYGSFRKDRDGWRAAPGHIFIPFPAR